MAGIDRTKTCAQVVFRSGIEVVGIEANECRTRAWASQGRWLIGRIAGGAVRSVGIRACVRRSDWIESTVHCVVRRECVKGGVNVAEARNCL